MRLECLRVINFRQYYGEQMIEFSTAKDLNVTVFHGDNGAGKTSLFSAVNWCLYNAAVEDIGELVCKEALANAEEGKPIPVVVTVIFMNKGRRYVAERNMFVHKNGKGFRRETPQFSLSEIKRSGDKTNIPNPIGVMNSILPENVRPYFFFDGEKMDDLTRADNREVESAIRNIMHLPVLEKAENHLKTIAREYRGQISREGSSELEKLISDEESVRKEKDNLLSKRLEIKDEIRIAKEQIEDLQDTLRGMEGAKALQKSRDDYLLRIDQLEKREVEIIRNIQKRVNRSYLKHLNVCSGRALEIVDKKREKGEIPSGIREQFVQDLIDQSICVCGRSFEIGDDAYKCLNNLIEKATSSKLENEVLQMAGNIRVLSNTASSEIDVLEDLCKDYETIIRQKKNYEGLLDDVERQLKNIGEEDIYRLETKRSKFERTHQLKIAESGKIDYQIINAENSLDEIFKRRKKAEESEKRLALLAKKEELAQRSADAVSKIKEQFFEMTRQEIERSTKEVFNKLAWKQDHFQDLSVDKDFKIEVIDRWKMPTRKELSAGERQILSLSFITAMSRLSDVEAPILMDTPFGRLSGNHLSAVAENLPELVPQLILFVTDREWDEASKSNLEPKVGAQYRLNFDQTTGCTKIDEVGYD
jgi:DNA sulfur modification protein DndD